MAFYYDVRARKFRGVLLRRPSEDVVVTCKGKQCTEKHQNGRRERAHVVAMMMIIIIIIYCGRNWEG